MADQLLTVIINEDGGKLRSGFHFLSSYGFLLFQHDLFSIFPYILFICKAA